MRSLSLASRLAGRAGCSAGPGVDAPSPPLVRLRPAGRQVVQVEVAGVCVGLLVRLLDDEGDLPPVRGEAGVADKLKVQKVSMPIVFIRRPFLPEGLLFWPSPEGERLSLLLPRCRRRSRFARGGLKSCAAGRDGV